LEIGRRAVVEEKLRAVRIPTKPDCAVTFHFLWPAKV